MNYRWNSPQRVYDHRLRELVRSSGDITIATSIGVPRSTAAGWVRAEAQNVVTIDVLDMHETELQAEVLRLRERILVLAIVVRLLMAVVRVSCGRLEGVRVPDGAVRAFLVQTVERAREVLPLHAVLRILGLSASRFHAWTGGEADCHPPELLNCPKRAPNQLTVEEASIMKDMATALEFRHVPTSRLAVLAQRLGRLFASASTWAKWIREKGWRRPRVRVHPHKPKVGLRTTRPDEAWHVDVTVLRLLNGTKVYVHAVIDNYSRRILAYCVSERFEIANAVAVLAEAAKKAVTAGGKPMLVVDAGIENFNKGVDALIDEGVLTRVLALTDLRFSNSLIERFWNSAKSQWLFLNDLDSVAAVRRLFAFYVTAHNTEIPHSAHRGQTPDEMYFGTGAEVPEKLAAGMKEAQAARLVKNRKVACGECSGFRTPNDEVVVAAAAA